MDDFRLRDIFKPRVLKLYNRQFSKVVKYLFESAERDFPTLNLHACQRIDSLKLPANTGEKPEETELEKDKKSSSVSSFFSNLRKRAWTKNKAPSELNISQHLAAVYK